MKDYILVVEDDIINLKLLSSILEKHGFIVLKAVNGEDTMKLLNEHKITGAILDLNLPDTNGLEILKYIRAHPVHKTIAILIVTENNDKLDTIISLEMGADDYITKPFHSRELIARLNAAIRRSKAVKGNTNSIITVHDLLIDTEKRLVKKSDKVINLSFKEFELMHLLVSNLGKVMSREVLLDKIGGLDYSPETRVIDMHISSLRKKLGDTKKQKHYIDTVTGIGYRFREK